MNAFHLVIDPASGVSQFEQVRTQIAAAVATGQLSAGTKLPTVRGLAADLGLANVTVARAYRELEADGVLATRGRAGTFVRSDFLDGPTAGSGTAGSGTAGSGTAGAARAAAADYVRTLRRLGLSSQEAARLVEIAWKKG